MLKRHRRAQAAYRGAEKKREFNYLMPPRGVRLLGGGLCFICSPLPESVPRGLTWGGDETSEHRMPGKGIV